ncbi:MAG: sulfur carrier protein ThiS [Bacillota bacterium]
MEITVNGEQEKLAAKTSLIDFLEAKELDLDKLVIEYNQEIIKETEWSSITLKDGDQLEILKFVGGG